MCLIFLSVNNHPTYKLVIAANRDEFYQRRTAPANYWHDNPTILGGRDLEAQGTWMAMTTSGKLGMITNYRDLSNINPSAPSRGQLVSEFLSRPDKPDEYLKTIHETASTYNGFNLVVGNQDKLFYYSNYQSKIIPLASGFFGLSNHLLDTPWPKVSRGKSKLEPLLLQEVIDPASLFEILKDEQIAPDNELPKTGLELARERALSAMFIKTPNYGSRCSTVILIDKENNVRFIERVFDLQTFDYQEKEFKWRIRV